MILVTGATGNVGAHVVSELAMRGASVRAFVRDPARARALLGEDVALAEGDFADARSLRAAMQGVERVFLSSADGLDKVAYETAVIDAAVAAGVRLIVKCSTIGAAVGSSLPPFDWHARIEERLMRSGATSVVLRSCFFMTNLLAAAEQVRETGQLVAPAGEGRIAMIDPRDTAAVAARILLEPAPDAGELVLTGPEAITYADVAAELSRAAGTNVAFVDVGDDAMREALVAAAMPDWLVRHLGALYPLIRADGLAGTSETVLELTGHSPRSFADFAQDHAHVFTSSPVSRNR